MHGIVIVSVEVGRGGGRDRSQGSVDALSTGGFNGSGLGSVVPPPPFLSSQVVKGSAQASEHPQMLWSLQVDIERELAPRFTRTSLKCAVPWGSWL